LSWLARIRGAIDSTNRVVAEAASWLALAMVLIGAFNAVARYVGRSIGWNLSSNLYLEAQWYLFSALFLLAAADTLRRDRHVRVDVFYGRLSPRGRAVVDSVGALVFLLPFCLFVLWISWPWVLESWRVREGSPDPGGLARYPIKALILVAFALLALQGIAQVLASLEAWRTAEGTE
jgi:TRAP-type mannitol/chloroaromatic compound transport system permease small subunit